MTIAIITGSGGLIGSESVNFFSKKFEKVIGIDNNLRKSFFGLGASVIKNINNHKKIKNYTHANIDIRDYNKLEKIFQKYKNNVKLIIHCAAQPSHDFAASDPFLDYSVNSTGTLNLLEAFRNYSKNAVFIHCSTNKVYGDRSNSEPYIEKKTRYSPKNYKILKNGFDEHYSIDQSKHSLFGASKLSADILCQEYGKYFGLKIGIFRGGCLTGSYHKGAKLHGFLSYLIKCSILREKYTIIGYKGKQVRDNIHSSDLISAFFEFYKKPKKGEVYNIGGGIKNNCSIIEAITLIEKELNHKTKINFNNKPRIGDHIWWISDTRKFENHFPNWKQSYSIDKIIKEMINTEIENLSSKS